MSYSQFNQDINILNFYNDKKFGFFVEAGAQDGCNYSNSYYLEKNNYWNGICVECNPYWYNKLCNNRKNTLNYNYALYNSDDDSLDFINDNIGGCSGILETNKNNNVLHNNEIIKVNTKKLTTILDMANAPSFIEFLSLDTEGSEYEILKSHDFNKYLFGYLRDSFHKFICDKAHPNWPSFKIFLLSRTPDSIKLFLSKSFPYIPLNLFILIDDIFKFS